ncbi:alpha-glucosidase/alpha-galactosidase [Paenibacillaceae bacterium]|nr:alpha-glucosidase/alpha-galactosidase [Paenibacillaceae bacterium]
MIKITFVGAGSTIFAKNILGDCMRTPALANAHMALYDINSERLNQSEKMLNKLNQNLGGHATIKSYTDRKEALRGANYVINAIAVGELVPTIMSDFEIPEKYGLYQTVGDTLGMGGLFRGLRTIPVMLDMAREMEEVCPDAWLLNYTNPMAIVTGAMLQATGVKTVGLCHSVQTCAKELLEGLGMAHDNVNWKIAGINHQAWLLEIKRDGLDLYPEIRQKAAARTEPHFDRVRYEYMQRIGYFVTESSSHGSEYVPYYLKRQYPELKDQFMLSTDGYKNWGSSKIEYWNEVSSMIESTGLTHERSHEYASYIMEAIETNQPFEIAGNVLNTGGLISNLPHNACVEVPCMVNANGILPTRFGALPPQCAALNQTNINMQQLTIEAALTGKREHVYHAAMLDPHTSSELSIDDIVALCDEMLEANQDFLSFK